MNRVFSAKKLDIQIGSIKITNDRFGLMGYGTKVFYLDSEIIPISSVFFILEEGRQVNVDVSLSSWYGIENPNIIKGEKYSHDLELEINNEKVDSLRIINEYGTDGFGSRIYVNDVELLYHKRAEFTHIPGKPATLVVEMEDKKWMGW
jgi:hypothetical protein